MIHSHFTRLVGFLLIIGVGWPASGQESGVRLIPAEPLVANPVSLPEAVEFHIVTGYRTEIVDGRSVVTVTVDRPGAAVALVLNSHASILWRLEATLGTTIVAVFVDSHIRLPHVETTLDVPVRQLDLPSSYERDDARFNRLLQTLQTALHMDRAATIQASHTIPGTIVIREAKDSALEESNRHPDPTELPEPTAADPAVRFWLTARDGERQEWTLTGPIDGRFGAAVPPDSVLLSPNRGRTYRFSSSAMVVVDAETNEVRSIPMRPGMPTVTGSPPIAYDTRRDEIALVTSGSRRTGGFLYRFDAGAERWIDVRPIGNYGIGTLAYDPVDDRYLGIHRVHVRGRSELFLVDVPAGTGGMPRIIMQPELVGLDQFLDADGLDILLLWNLWLVPTERGYVFLSVRSRRVIWWLPRGSSTAELTFSEAARLR